MREKVRVTFIEHSGFLVETEKSYLLFDYWKGSIPPLDPKKTLYVFASHFHHDHYTKEIFKLEKRCHKTFYIMSDDIRQNSGYWKQVSHFRFVNPGDIKQVDGCHITAFDSTDEGVAFLVEVDGCVFFHAGDLHWWDWPGEPEEENQMMKKRYCAEIDRLKGKKINVAFVVVDPRQEESGGLGMDYFVENVDAEYIFPMHFWEDYAYVRDYFNKSRQLFKKAQFMYINKPGQTFDI